MKNYSLVENGWELVKSLWIGGYIPWAIVCTFLFFFIKYGVKWIKKFIDWKSGIIRQKIENEYRFAKEKIEIQFSKEAIDEKIESWMDALKKGIIKDQRSVDEKLKNHSSEIATIKNVHIEEMKKRLSKHETELVLLNERIYNIKLDIEEIKNGQNNINKLIQNSSEKILNEIKNRKNI